ncbi:hypothetical protein [Pseudogemmobacter humi]|uniref:Helix-turn-helix domain protein n=1 Tax=Pseudogemmobacter humi TaxID=2483812 RepID=A0A3P5XMB8_9RHOB|nr:hypothetical protein [Pseudogemmobacter humi]VDC31406.1 hypothetical protein XINFAN_02876 [Pseudogemmobacter humi]
MADLNTTELAARLSVSKARISQYVAEGKLAGCYTGDGRARRFDLAKVADALGKRLDLGQMTGNGLSTRRAIRDIGEGSPTPAAPQPRDGSELPYRDPDRLELATIQIKEEEARRRRRDNERDEGRWVLAEEVQRHTARAVSREIGQFETVIRDAARAVADRFGVDFREVRKVMMDEWRRHRGNRRDELREEAAGVGMSEAEAAANV